MNKFPHFLLNICSGGFLRETWSLSFIFICCIEQNDWSLSFIFICCIEQSDIHRFSLNDVKMRIWKAVGACVINGVPCICQVSQSLRDIRGNGRIFHMTYTNVFLRSIDQSTSSFHCQQIHFGVYWTGEKTELEVTCYIDINREYIWKID